MAACRENFFSEDDFDAVIIPMAGMLLRELRRSLQIKKISPNSPFALYFTWPYHIKSSSKGYLLGNIHRS